jgi:hypothetical protein
MIIIQGEFRKVRLTFTPFSRTLSVVGVIRYDVKVCSSGRWLVR